MTENLYAIKARFAILVEGQTKGLQQYEDRIVLIKGKNEQEAEGKAIQLLPSKEEPYLNSDKRFVWYKFEEVIDICDCYAFESNDYIVEGMEIYSERYSRKLKPENTWFGRVCQLQSHRPSVRPFLPVLEDRKPLHCHGKGISPARTSGRKL